MSLVGRKHNCLDHLPEATEEIYEDKQVHTCDGCENKYYVYAIADASGLFFRNITWTYHWTPYVGFVDFLEPETT